MRITSRRNRRNFQLSTFKKRTKETIIKGENSVRVILPPSCGCPSVALERQVVGAFSFGCRCGGKRRVGCGGCGGWRDWRTCRCADGSGDGCRRERLIAKRGGVYLTNIVGSDAVEPTAIVFTGIDVEEYLYFLPDLNIKTAQTVFSKDGEHHFMREIFVGLNNKILCFPVAAGRLTASNFCCGNNSSL